MLETVSTLEHLGIHARDGDIGRVGDVLFDDQTWTVRYLVVRTGGWLRQRRVLLSPIAILDVDEKARTVSVDLTREEIAGSPPLDTDMPLSRQMELKYRDYFSWPAYWVSTYLDAYHRKTYPRLAEADREVSEGQRARREPALPNIPEHDPHLRSTATITGYNVYASDSPRSPAGHVRDFTVETDGWTVQSLIVEVGHHKFAVPRECVRDIDWPLSIVHLRLSHDDLHAQPAFREAHR